MLTFQLRLKSSSKRSV